MKKKDFTKTLLLSALLSGWTLFAGAENTPVWHLTTDTEQSVPMTEVDFLLAADETEYFSVVLKDGSQIDQVKQVVFEKKQATGLEEETRDRKPALYPTIARSQLTLTGCQNGTRIRILSINGTLCREMTVTEQETHIGVEDLTPGQYLLQAGNNTLQFIKP